MSSPTRLASALKVLIILTVIGFVSHLGALTNRKWMKLISMSPYDDDDDYTISTYAESLGHLGFGSSALWEVAMTDVFVGHIKNQFQAMQGVGVLSLMFSVCGLLLRILALWRIETPVWRMMAFICALVEAVLTTTTLGLLWRTRLLLSSEYELQVSGRNVPISAVYDEGYSAPVIATVVALVILLVSLFSFGPGLRECSRSLNPEYDTSMTLYDPSETGLGAIPHPYQQFSPPVNYHGYEG